VLAVQSLLDMLGLRVEAEAIRKVVWQSLSKPNVCLPDRPN
jgi:hypothetical protein